MVDEQTAMPEDITLGDASTPARAPSDVSMASEITRPPPETAKADAMRIARPAATESNPASALGDVVGGIGKHVTDMGQKAGGWFGENRNWIIPLLSGLGGMASSPSRYLGSAILQGLGTGAQAYGQEQQAEANLAQTQAHNRGINIDNLAHAMEVQKKGFWTDTNGRPHVMGPNGEDMTLAEWWKMKQAGRAPKLIGDSAIQVAAHMTGETRGPQTETPAGQVSGAPSAPTAPTAPNAPAAAGAEAAPAEAAPAAAGAVPLTEEQQAENDAKSTISVGGKGAQMQKEMSDRYNNVPSLVMPNSPARKMSDEMYAGVTAEASAARSQRFLQQQLTNDLLNMPDGEMLSGGPLNPVTKVAANYYNSFLDHLGLTPEQLKKYKVDTNELGTQTAADKLTNFMAFSGSKTMDQRSLGALQEAFGMTPGTHMTKEASVKVLTALAAVQQRAIDRDQYLTDWNRKLATEGTDRFSTTQDAMRAFEAEHGDRYGAEQKAYERALLAKHKQTGRHLFTDIYEKKLGAHGVDNKFQTEGKPSKGLSRWFGTY